MNPEQAEAVANAMVALWQGEFPATVRVISAMEGGDRDYKPHPKSRTALNCDSSIPCRARPSTMH